MRYSIRELREKKGMTQDELAEKANVARATLYWLETQPNRPAMSTTLVKIANALGVDVGELFLADDD